MKTFYTDFDKMRGEKYDGMIITGAPVEQMDFEEVTYWDEITEIFDWRVRMSPYALHLLGGAGRALSSLWSAEVCTG